MKNKFSLLLFFFCCTSLAVSANSADTVSKENIREWVGAKSLSFLENKGQMTDMNGDPVPFVLFHAEAPGTNIYITEKGLTYVFFKAGEDKEAEEREREREKKAGEQPDEDEPMGEKIEVEWERIDMTIAGGKIKKENIVMENKSVEFSQYFLNHCPQGITDVHSYKKIIIKDVYPGIDWVIYTGGKATGFKYDFLVHPGADPKQIELVYSSHTKLNLENDIEIKTKYGTLTENAPVSYQRDNTIASSFIKTENVKNENGGYDTHIKFTIGNYAAGEMLTIDPQLDWSTFYGGNAYEGPLAIASDGTGNTFVTGYCTTVSGFPLQMNGGAYYQGTHAGGTEDIFILKFTNTGALQWATYYGGSGWEAGRAILVQPTGDVYVTGLTHSPNFPVQNLAGAYNQSVFGTGEDAFMLKFTSAGVRLWATFFGGSASAENAYGICSNAAGDVFITGWCGPNLPVMNPGGGAYFQGTTLGGFDAFISKFNSAGALVWSTYYGGTQNDQGGSICTDATGNLYITGKTNSTNFPVLNPFQATYAGGIWDAFYLKFNNVGAVVQSSYYGGDFDDRGGSIVVDAVGNVFSNGQTGSFNFLPLVNPGGGAYFQGSIGAVRDCYIFKLNSAGVLVWSTYYGGNSIDEMNDYNENHDNILLDANNNVYMTFGTASVGLPTMANCNAGYFDPTHNGGYDSYIVQFNNSGVIQWATYFGGDGNDITQVMAMDNSGTLFVSGEWTDGNGGPVTAALYPLVNPGGGAYFDNTYNGTTLGDDIYMARFIPINPIIASAVVTGAGCSSPTGSATVTASGGTPGYTYSWTPSGGNAATASNLAAGTYTCTITDGAGCTQNVIVLITTSSGGPTVILQSQQNVLCNGGNTGTATVNPSGGTPGYTYAWAPIGGTGITGTGLTAGNYTCTITDAAGCTTTQTVAITQPSAISASATSTNATCGNNDGTATTTASGGTGTLTYNWLPSGGTNAIANNLAAGNYTCTVTDANGCTQTASTTVINPGSPSVTLASQQNVLCNGGNSGSATVSPTGGTPGYTYAWTPIGGSAITGTGLTAGNYTCTITDAAGCIVTQTVAITEPGAISASATSTPAGCSANNGSATVTASGGTGTLTYNWLPSGGTAAIANNLAAGNYTCTITDANGCTQTASTTVVGSNSPSSTLQSQTDVTCNGGNTGTATVNPSGGTPGYTYAWSPIGGSAITGTGLTAGNYTCTITDAAGCTTTQTVLITEPSAISASATSTNATCGNNDGTATTTANGGTGTLTYNWLPSGGTNATANNLAAGNYTCTITDANGCTSTAFASVATIGGPVTNVQSSGDVTCFGGTNGSGIINATGSGPFTYAWSPSGGNAASATNLGAGTYSVSVTDANNCVSVQTITITEPPQLISNPTSTAAICGNNNGTADAVASGGTGTLTYNWLPSGGTNATANNLAAGNYTCTITDANGCSITSTVTITNNGAPVVTLQSSSNITCFNGTNGAATMNVTGGSSPYTYSWSPSGGTAASATNLGAGTYTVTVTGSDGCVQTQTVILTQPPAIALTNSSTLANCGSADGTASVSASGGTPGYTYVWSNASANDTISNLLAGSYTVTATDANGCTATSTVIVGNSGTATANAGASVTITSGQSVQLNGTGGVTYSWSPPTGLSCTNCQNPIASPTVTTTYILTVTDANGCTDTDSITVTVDIACGEVYLPNAFSPNGDNQNDVLYVRGNCVKYFDFKIYNRWGEEVFYTADISKGWDGTWRGKACEAAVFTYVLRATLFDGTEINKQGNISLVK